MKFICETVNTPVTEYEAESEEEAIEKYSENWRINYKYVKAVEVKEQIRGGNVEALELTDVSLMMSSDTQYAVIEIAHDGSVIDSVRPLDLRNWLDKVAPSKQITLKEALEALQNKCNGKRCTDCVCKDLCSLLRFPSPQNWDVDKLSKALEALCQKK